MTTMRLEFTLLLLFVIAALISSFQPSSFITTKRCTFTRTTLNAEEGPIEFSDFPDADKPDKDSADIDWDSEWKKVVDGQVTPKPTSGIYKSDVELAAIKAKKSAELKINDVQYNAAKAIGGINIRSLQGDWRFWIGLLAVLSIGTSILSAGQTAPNDSFYI